MYRFNKWQLPHKKLVFDRVAEKASLELVAVLLVIYFSEDNSSSEVWQEEQEKLSEISLKFEKSGPTTTIQTG